MVNCLEMVEVASYIPYHIVVSGVFILAVGAVLTWLLQRKVFASSHRRGLWVLLLPLLVLISVKTVCSALSHNPNPAYPPLLYIKLH